MGTAACFLIVLPIVSGAIPQSRSDRGDGHRLGGGFAVGELGGIYALATKQSPGLFLPNLLLVTLAKFGASSSSHVPYRSKPLLFMRKAKVICRLFHCSSSPQKGFRLSGDPDVGSSPNK